MSSYASTAADTTGIRSTATDPSSACPDLTQIPALRLGIDIDRGNRGAVRLCEVSVRRKPPGSIIPLPAWEPTTRWLWWVRGLTGEKYPKHGMEFVYRDGVLPSTTKDRLRPQATDLFYKKWRLRCDWFGGAKRTQRADYVDALNAMVEGEEEEYKITDHVSGRYPGKVVSLTRMPGSEVANE